MMGDSATKVKNRSASHNVGGECRPNLVLAGTAKRELHRNRRSKAAVGPHVIASRISRNARLRKCRNARITTVQRRAPRLGTLFLRRDARAAPRPICRAIYASPRGLGLG